jgi:hypothetical protein
MNARLRRTLLLAAPALVATAIVAPISATAMQTNARAPLGTTGDGRTHCGTVRGAPWSIKTPNLHVSGSLYVVSTEGSPSCALARKWVPALTRQPNHGVTVPVSGPAGFKCSPGVPPLFGDKLTFGGGCVAQGKEFQWAPKSKLFSYS